MSAVAETPAASWEVWDGTRAKLARYVSVNALRDLQGLGRVRANLHDLQADLRALYESLEAQDIEYALQPWTPRGHQQVRHPQWVVRDRWGTCLDLSLMFAAMCLELDLRPFVATAPGHAYVVVDVSRRLDSEVDSAASFAKDEVFDVDEDVLSLIASGDWVAVDCIEACVGGAGYETALAKGRELVEKGARLVNVARLHKTNKQPALAPPATGLQPLPLYLPSISGGTGFVAYSAHRETAATLENATGTVVLLGPSGRGKSTLARHLAERQRLGAAWFLNASEPKTLTASLADAERAAHNRTIAGTSDADRSGFTDAALARLATTDEPWIVVLDNADGDPGALAPLMPRPGAGDLVVVTSTNPAWLEVPGVEVVELPPLDPQEVADAVGPELVPLVDGRPLMLEAFRALQEGTGLEAAEIATHVADDDVSPDLRGPLALWRAARARTIAAADLRAALAIAYLPPGQQPREDFEALGADVLATTESLRRAGLIGIGTDGYVRMHRLVGAAIRYDLRATKADLDEEVVQLVAGEPRLRSVLDRYGDLATISRVDERLAEIDASRPEPDPRVGIALHGTASLLELHGQTRTSEQTFVRAERHLSDRPDLVADVLHSKARTVNQQHSRDEERLKQALAWAQEAERLLGSTGATAARAHAMQGLLLQKLARFAPDDDAHLHGLKEALSVIEEAHDRRVEVLEPDDPELARSEFNLAGIRINLARAEPERTSEHLDRAAEVYRSVWKRRHERIYRRPVHPHIAACIIGLAYVDYFRALLIPASDEQRAEWLRNATSHANEALFQRQELDGPVDGPESRKAARFLAKVALLRHAPRHDPRTAIDSVAAEAAAEAAQAVGPLEDEQPAGRRIGRPGSDLRT